MQPFQVEAGKGHIALILEVINARKNLGIDDIAPQSGHVRRQTEGNEAAAGRCQAFAHHFLQCAGLTAAVQPAEQQHREGQRDLQDEKLPRTAQRRRKGQQAKTRRPGPPAAAPGPQKQENASETRKADGDMRDVV